MRQWLSKGSLLGRFFFQTIGAFLLVMGFGGWVAWFGLRGTEPARAEEALGRMGLSRGARGERFVRLQGLLRLGPAAALGVGWSWGWRLGWVVGGGFAVSWLVGHSES